MKIKAGAIVSRRQALKPADVRSLTNGSQKDKADAVCRHRFLGAHLLLIEPEERGQVGGCFSDGGPAEEETSERKQAKDVSVDCLEA